MVSNDMRKFDNFFRSFHYLWLAPLELVMTTYLVWQMIGWLSIIASLYMLLFIPTLGVIGKKIKHNIFFTCCCNVHKKNKSMHMTSVKLKLTNQTSLTDLVIMDLRTILYLTLVMTSIQLAAHPLPLSYHLTKPTNNYYPGPRGQNCILFLLTFKLC